MENIQKSVSWMFCLMPSTPIPNINLIYSLFYEQQGSTTASVMLKTDDILCFLNYGIFCLSLIWFCKIQSLRIEYEYFLFLYISVKFSQHHLLNKLSLAIVYACFLCQILTMKVSSLFCSIDLCVCFYASTMLF